MLLSGYKRVGPVLPRRHAFRGKVHRVTLDVLDFLDGAPP